MDRSEAAGLALALLLLAVPLGRAAGRGSAPPWAERPQGAISGVGSLLFGSRIDPNTAAVADLTVLPRIGPARAAAIAVERERGPFCRSRDLERVHGLGPRTVAGLGGWIALDPLPPACAAGLP